MASCQELWCVSRGGAQLVASRDDELMFLSSAHASGALDQCWLGCRVPVVKRKGKAEKCRFAAGAGSKAVAASFPRRPEVTNRNLTSPSLQLPPPARPRVPLRPHKTLAISGATMHSVRPTLVFAGRCHLLIPNAGFRLIIPSER